MVFAGMVTGVDCRLEIPSFLSKNGTRWGIFLFVLYIGCYPGKEQLDQFPLIASVLGIWLSS
ncbi:hypothetical protein [Pasteuria penetrans]|uniref:hypothetical protein n=1 Tax=Pasteuria penetrans TaxID=86005 RepID=UPI0011EF5E6B|nr:hypothetical protein [Pasteuria penetrans]